MHGGVAGSAGDRRPYADQTAFVDFILAGSASNGGSQAPPIIHCACFRVGDHPRESRERYFKRYTTVVSVSAGSGVGSP